VIGVREPTLNVVPAGPDDLSTILAILTEAAEWGLRRGVVGLWRVPFPEEWILPSLTRGEVYLGRWNDEVVGTITLRWTDERIWGEQPPVAGYVHRLASRRKFGGRRVGARLLDWAADRIRRDGRSRLRLDCWSTHAGLRRYYQSLGFGAVGNVMVDEAELVLWERSVLSGDSVAFPG
jgi:GNAT superfamily N-acetyltransferase